MIDLEMREQLISPQMLIKGLIKGNKFLNYENYIIDFLNASTYFSKISKGKKYEHSKSEHAYQCDCYAGDYGIDFKLLVSNSLAHALAELRNQYYTQNGVTIVSGPNRDGTMGTVVLHKVLRNCSEDSLEYIGEDDGHFDLYMYEIEIIQRIFKTKKNILLFFPYTFIFEKKYSFEFAADLIKNALQKDFAPAFGYRQSKVGDYETYMAFIYCDRFVIMKYENDELKIVDIINTDKSDVFQEMKSLALL